MIELRITGCCAGCDDIDLRMTSEVFGIGPVYEVHCVHHMVCGRLEKELMSLIRRTPEDRIRPMETRKE